MKIIFLNFFLFFLCIPFVAADVDYSLFANVLKTYVDQQGFVNYTELKNHRADLDRFVQQLALKDISTWSANEQKAFWINAYNALTIQTILDHYPVKSIRKIWKVWDQPKNVNRGQYTLNQIEHEIVRPLGDARVHFAFNCASIGCPRLPQQPFYPETLDQQLDQETVRFVNDPERVRMEGNTLYLSSIFKWFKEDFQKMSGSPFNFVKKYVHSDKKDKLSPNMRIKFLKYDWGLNDQSRQ